MLTVERLREVLSYDPDAGLWTWRVNQGSRALKGSRAGSDSDRGYRVIRVDRKLYRAGRLAWLYVTGVWPENEVDHENGVRMDDRWSNLREATRTQNNSNKEVPGSNKSGFKGVSWSKHAKKWRASISIRNAQKNLGYFDSPQDASAAYFAAARREHGEFARI